MGHMEIIIFASGVAKMIKYINMYKALRTVSGLA